MSLQKYESDVRHLNKSQAEAYYFLSDLSHLTALRARLTDPVVQEKLHEQLPSDRLDQILRFMEKTEFTPDSISVDSPIGRVMLRVVEREEPKLIKLASEGSPVPLTLWVQIVPDELLGSKMRITLGADVNMFMKALVAKPLQQAADGIAAAFAAVVEMNP